MRCHESLLSVSSRRGMELCKKKLNECYNSLS